MDSSKQPVYGLRMDTVKFRLMFYEAYDENYLYNKAAALMYQLRQGQKGQERVNKWLTKGGMLPLGTKFAEALRAELYFLTLHQFEAFFALLIAPFQRVPEWIFLTVYETGELRDAIQQFINHDIASLTHDRLTQEREFISRALYNNQQPTEEAVRVRWDENLDNALRIIQAVAAVSLRDKEAYNAYKHGMRAMTGPGGIKATIPGAPGQPDQPLMEDWYEDALLFLDIDKKAKPVRDVRLTKMEIHPEISFEMLQYMHLMLAAIKTTRLAALQGSKPVGSTLPSFAGIEIEDLVQRWEQGSRFTVQI